jgi:hypothetical protein
MASKTRERPENILLHLFLKRQNEIFKVLQNQEKNGVPFSMSLNGGLIPKVSLTEKDLVDQEAHGHQLRSKPSKPEF